MSKRIKSFLITATSILGTAFVAITVTPEWVNFVTFVNDKATSLGVPAVVIALVGVFIAEVWKSILNARALKKAESMGVAASRSLDLY